MFVRYSFRKRLAAPRRELLFARARARERRKENDHAKSKKWKLWKIVSYGADGNKILPSQFFILLKNNGHSDTFLFWHILPAGDPCNITDASKARARFWSLERAGDIRPRAAYPPSGAYRLHSFFFPPTFPHVGSREPNDPYTSNYGSASSAVGISAAFQ